MIAYAIGFFNREERAIEFCICRVIDERAIGLQRSFCKQLLIDIIIAVALKLINPEHLRNWFANCCYCIS